MSWKIKLNAKKHDGDKYTITSSVLQSPKPGTYSDWDSPHSTWEKAISHAKDKLKAGHSEDTVYIASDKEFTDYEEALKNLKKPS